MQVPNLTQYAAAFVAFGCKLNYRTDRAEPEISEVPNWNDRKQRAQHIIEAAVEDITKFENTANYEDGLSVLVLCDLIDGEPNPLTEIGRKNILYALDITSEDGRFISQELNLAKVNRSWHISEKSNTCTYFGELCTHRGIVQISGKRGRKSNRQPNEYHLQSSKGIGREQLVTPALQTLYDNIPGYNLVSQAEVKPIQFDLESIRGLTQIQANELLAVLEERITATIA